MIAVGIDVSKAKSTVAILNGDGSIRAKPFDVHHVADELQALVDYIKRTSEPPTILMEPGGTPSLSDQSIPDEEVWRYRTPKGENRQT